MNTTWSIVQCEHKVETGFIITAHWTASATDGDYSASAYGSCGLGDGTPTIPYTDVTEQEVLDWVWANGVDKDVTKANLATQIEVQKNPVQASGIPW
jgi:hypothetical protein